MMVYDTFDVPKEYDVTYDEHVEIENQLATSVVKRWRTESVDEHGQAVIVEVVEARVFDELLARNQQTEKDLSELADVAMELTKVVNELKDLSDNSVDRAWPKRS